MGRRRGAHVALERLGERGGALESELVRAQVEPRDRRVSLLEGVGERGAGEWPEAVAVEAERGEAGVALDEAREHQARELAQPAPAQVELRPAAAQQADRQHAGLLEAQCLERR